MAEYVTRNTRVTWGAGSITFDHRRLSSSAVGGQKVADLLGPTLAVQSSIPWTRVTGVNTDGRWVRLEIEGRPSKEEHGVETDTDDEAERLAEQWAQYVM